MAALRCPKCRADVPDLIPECPHCGIIFTKYLEREEPLPRNLPERTADVENDRRSVVTLLLGVESSTPMPVAIGRGVFLLLMGIWTTTLVSRAVSVEGISSVMHLPNLVFHEAGHILFLPLGRFMSVLGGSLTQVLVPLVCAGTFLLQTRDAFGAAIAIWWAGQSLTDVAPYINDARNLQLVLLGGKTGAEVEGHDWEYLLNAMGASHHDHAIALVVQTIGTLTMIFALVWGGIVVLNQMGILRSRRAEL
jgi:hypothetical protein